MTNKLAFPIGLVAAFVGSTLPLASTAEPIHFSSGPVLRGGTADALVVESSSIEREDSRVTWVQESVRHNGRGSLVYKARALMLADCTNRDLQIRRQLTVFVEAGQPVEPYLSPGETLPVEEVRPGTAAAKALNYVCRQAIAEDT